jgi:hypothetical protein
MVIDSIANTKETMLSKYQDVIINGRYSTSKAPFNRFLFLGIAGKSW